MKSISLTDYPGSRRLITYRRLPNSEVDPEALVLAAAAALNTPKPSGHTANDLNPFRKSYFSKFEVPGSAASSSGASTPAKSEPIAEIPEDAPVPEAPAAVNIVPATQSIPKPDSRPDPAVTSEPAHAPD